MMEDARSASIRNMTLSQTCSQFQVASPIAETQKSNWPIKFAVFVMYWYSLHLIGQFAFSLSTMKQAT